MAIHEAGHAAAAHVYLKGAESTRISIRRRGGALGHHMALEKEERFSSWRHEELGRLTWALGAMAAERVFYGENSTGVGGDVQSATARASWMVGSCAMAPEPVSANGVRKKDEETKRMVEERLRKIGTQIMMRAGSSPMHGDQIASVTGDRDKRMLVTQFLGEAFVTAYHLIQHNKEQVEKVAEAIIDKREVYGNELLELLDEAKLEVPEVDLTKEEAWPRI